MLQTGVKRTAQPSTALASAKKAKQAAVLPPLSKPFRPFPSGTRKDLAPSEDGLLVAAEAEELDPVVGPILRAGVDLAVLAANRAVTSRENVNRWLEKQMRLVVDRIRACRAEATNDLSNDWTLYVAQIADIGSPQTKLRVVESLLAAARKDDVGSKSEPAQRAAAKYATLCVDVLVGIANSGKREPLRKLVEHFQTLALYRGPPNPSEKRKCWSFLGLMSAAERKSLRDALRKAKGKSAKDANDLVNRINDFENCRPTGTPDGGGETIATMASASASASVSGRTRQPGGNGAAQSASAGVERCEPPARQSSDRIPRKVTAPNSADLGATMPPQASARGSGNPAPMPRDPRAPHTARAQPAVGHEGVNMTSEDPRPRHRSGAQPSPQLNYAPTSQPPPNVHTQRALVPGAHHEHYASTVPPTRQQDFGHGAALPPVPAADRSQALYGQGDVARSQSHLHASSQVVAYGDRQSYADADHVRADPREISPANTRAPMGGYPPSAPTSGYPPSAPMGSYSPSAQMGVYSSSAPVGGFPPVNRNHESRYLQQRFPTEARVAPRAYTGGTYAPLNSEGHNHESILKPVRAPPQCPDRRVMFKEVDSYPRRTYLTGARAVYEIPSQRDVLHLFCDPGDPLDFGSMHEAHRIEIQQRINVGSVHSVMAVHAVIKARIEDFVQAQKGLDVILRDYYECTYPRCNGPRRCS